MKRRQNDIRSAFCNLTLAFCASITISARVQARETSRPTSYKQVLPRDAGQTEDYEGRGIARVQTGAFDEAISDLSHAIQLNPTNPTAVLYRACAYRAKGAFEQSIRDWDRYILLNPTNDFAYKSRASVYNVTRQFDRAIKDWDEGLRLSPKDATALAMRGFAFAGKGQYSRAIDDFTEAFRLDPVNQSAHNNLGWLRATCPVAAIRNGKEAVREATIACELTSWADWTRIDTLAAAFAETGQFKKAVGYQKRAMAMREPSGDDLRAMRQRLSLYQQRQPYREVQQ